MGKIVKKEEICFRRKLKSKPFIMTEVGNYLENKLKIEKICHKRRNLCLLRVELKTFHNSRGG